MAEPGTLRTGEAVPTKKRGLFGGAPKEPAGAGRHGDAGSNACAIGSLLICQMLTAMALFIWLGGLASMQRNANDLQLANPTQQALYSATFVDGNVIPYPNQGSKQFGLPWWIWSLEVFIFFVVLALMAMPRMLARLKFVVMAFLVYMFVLLTLQIDSLLFFKRSILGQVNWYREQRIKTALAGTIMTAIANAFTIIALGMLHDTTHEHPQHHHTGPAYAPAGKHGQANEANDVAVV